MRGFALIESQILRLTSPGSAQFVAPFITIPQTAPGSIRRSEGIIMHVIRHPVLPAILVSLLVAGCSDGENPSGEGLFSEAELEKARLHSPLPPLKPDTTNMYADNENAAKLGQRFFFEKGYSGPIVVGDDGMNGGLGAVGETGKVSCRSCHLGDFMIDTRSKPNGTSLAIDWFFRNSPTLINVATYETQFGWVGFNDNLWGKNLIPAEFVMGTNRSDIVKFIYSKYKDEYNAIFSPPLDDTLLDEVRFPKGATPLNPMSAWTMMAEGDRDIINRAYANFGKAIQAYERKLIVGESPFDRFVAGDEAAISDSAKRGLKLFIGKAACSECHSGPTFSDELFHVTGVPQIGDHVPEADDGRFGAIDVYLGWDFNTAGKYNDDPSINRTTGVTKDAKLTGAFRSKGLRNIAMTGPYMHTGHMTTLTEVVEFYNEGGATTGFAGTKDTLMKPLNLSSSEVADIVAFLEALTGDPVPASLLEDTAGP